MTHDMNHDASHVSDSALTAAFPSEVVTTAYARDVALPRGTGTMVLITLDNGHDYTRPNTFGPASLLSLESAIDAAVARGAAGEIVAIALTGKPYVFAAGADLTGAATIAERAEALAVARLGHRVLSKLGPSAPVPTFVFWNGAALGGGVEIGLHATYRTISTGVAAFALPECSIGLLPGWGGTTLLPRLVGPEVAVRVIIENPLARNTMLRPAQVVELGIADAIFEPADFLERSIGWAIDVLRGDVRVERSDHLKHPEAWAKALARGRAAADARVHHAAPAPYRALDLLEAGPDRTVADGFAAEDEALAELIMTDEFRASVYAFDLVQRRAKRPAGAPDAALAKPVTKVGVVGAGLMAAQLAVLFARRLQVPVVMTDVDDERVARGLSHVSDQIDSLLAKHRVSSDAANRLRASITGAVGVDAFGDADLVIEAVFEELGVKRDVLAAVEQVVRPDCVLATNTSSLSVTAIADGLAHPERVVGMHFFNPVAVMPLLEVVRTPATDDATIATALATGRTLRKSCILVSDAPAFVVNRVFARFVGEVLRAVDKGTPIEEADRALESLGLPMTPFELLDLTGVAVNLHVGETMHEAFPDRFGTSNLLRRMLDAHLTRVWIDTDGERKVDPRVRALVPTADETPTAEHVREAALAAVADEIRRMVDDGVVADVRDIDLGMILGAGWPFHLGGIAPYLDRTGVSTAVTGARFLPPGAASVPAARESVEASIPPSATTGAPPELPAAMFEVGSGELTSTALTAKLADVPIVDDPAPDTPRTVTVAFPMPLPVAQIGMFAGRPLPVPASAFTAVLHAFGTEMPVELRSIAISSATATVATLEVSGHVDPTAAGLPYAPTDVVLVATVTVS